MGTVHKGLLPSLAVILALLICKGLLYGTTVLALIGIAVDVPLGPWAVAVDLAVAFAVFAFWLNRRYHGSPWPTLFAAAGALLVIGRMHGPVPVELEWAGLVMLVAAAVFDWRARRLRVDG